MDIVQKFETDGLAERRALIYDDDEIYAEECAEALERFGYVTETRAGRTDFLRLVDAFSPDIVILDLHMPGRDGVEALRALRDYEHKGEVSVVLVSAASHVMLETAADLALAYGVKLLGTFSKPVKIADLAALLGGLTAAGDKTTQN
ncbi:MAG TPA: response regulator [Parvibaculum sp.]|jgi:CheY-like chemotaxis protein